MTTKLSALHKTVGVVTVIIFIGTGLLLRFHFSRIYEANHLVRMMFRSVHIYILLAGLINLALGSYMVASTDRRKLATQLIGSICLIVAPAILIGAFFIEPVRESLERGITQLGIILLLVGTLLHFFGASRGSLVSQQRRGWLRKEGS